MAIGHHGHHQFFTDNDLGMQKSPKMHDLSLQNEEGVFRVYSYGHALQ